MVSHDDLVRLWGETNIVHPRAKPRDTLTLPPDATQVLAEVGLPRRADPLFEVTGLRMVDVPGRGGRYCQFGSDFGTALCISANNGEIVSLSLTGEYPDRFVNSTLALFVEFLVLVSTERARFLDLGDEDIDQLIAELNNRLLGLDERALGNPDNWWAVVVEQMRDGLL